MVLDATQIDPVTGTALPADLGIIEQIPLGKQIVDWESLDATARPVRNPMYPDDTFALMANVQGTHPDTGSAQLVGTDGNHRLKVAATIEGGGGTASKILMPVDGIQGTFYSKSLTPGDEILRLYNTSNDYALIGFSATAVIDPAGTHADNSYALFYFEMNASGPDDRWLLSGTLAYGIGTNKASVATWSGNFIFPFPILPPNGGWYPWIISLGWEGTLDFEIAAQCQFAAIS